MNEVTPTKADVLSGLGHAIASVYTLAAQLLEPEWSECTSDERPDIDGPVQDLRTLAPHLENLQREAGATALQHALYLARAQVHSDEGVIGNALAIARTGAVLNHWLRTLAGLHSRKSDSGPLTLGELFQRVSRMSQDPRQRVALEDQTKERALETSAHRLIETSTQLTDQALGLLWLHGSLNGEKPSSLRDTAANLFTQASGVVLCAAGLLSATPFPAPPGDDE